MRNDNTLAPLAEDQLNELFTWLNDLSYAEVEKRVLQPPPVGFGLKVHVTTLRRFYQERLKAECDAALLDHADPASAGPLIAASQTALAYATYSLARSPARPDMLNHLSRTLHRHHSLELKRSFLDIAQRHAAIAEARVDIERQRLQLAEITFRFNAAKEAAIHAVAIKETLSSDHIDTEQKVWRVSDIVFGPSPAREKFASCSPNPAARPPATVSQNHPSKVQSGS
jgi:uncharacterized coiled-coil protein SlyX